MPHPRGKQFVAVASTGAGADDLKNPTVVFIIRLALALALGCMTVFSGAITAHGQEADSLEVQEPDTTDHASEADSLRAQEVDSTALEPEVDAAASMQRRSASLSQVVLSPLSDLRESSRPMWLPDSLPLRRSALDLAELVGDVPGAFLYRFGTPGWPDGWSYQGLPPAQAAMTFNGIPFSHVFTGRPGFDIAPMAFIRPPGFRIGSHHRPASVTTHLRQFAATAPYTDLKYWNGADGLHSIDAVHVQNRTRALFGSPGLLNVMGAYSGRAADGAYPGSRLRRGRQVQLRLQYGQARWSVEALNVHTRRTIGAHGGVIPEGQFLESIYSTVGAIVENPEATRRLIRNDLLASARFEIVGVPLSATGYWTAETFRYRDEADTVGANSDRLGFRVVQTLSPRSGSQRLLEFDVWTEHISPSLNFQAAGLRRSELHAAVQDSLSLLGWGVEARASMHRYDGALHPGGRLRLERKAGPVHFFAGASLSGMPASPVELMGFRALGARAPDRSGRLTDWYAGLTWGAGPFDVNFRVFWSRASNPRDIYMTTDYMDNPDSAAVLVAASAMNRAGATLDIGWRRDAERGFYALLQPTYSELLNGSDSPLHARTARSLPTLFGRGRIGGRVLLFLGDLDLDAFVDMYAWSATASRALHPETGHLAIPLLNALEFGPSSMINVGAEAGVRDATFFLIYENVLAGTQLMVGNLIVPIYPLPAQRFRFGVHWPIFN